MSIKNVNNNYNQHVTGANQPMKSQNTKATPDSKNPSIATDTFEPSDAYKMDFDKVTSMKASLYYKIDAFEKMINALFQKQGITYNQNVGMKENLEKLIASGGVSETERQNAQAAISADGEWGIEKTAQRILDFAMALSGGDPSKIETLKNAVIKGFKQAEAAWGGALPDICYGTFDKIMKGFEEWAATGKGPAE